MPVYFVRTRIETEAILALYCHDHDEIADVLIDYAEQTAVGHSATELDTPEDSQPWPNSSKPPTSA
ncbi:hypothetical protein ACFWBG_11095 [Nocardia salmonicida]|uniref:hypothetical protein n=1 Tax=Nocardia salmonicida TaxID=53431 RepID=UPI00366B806B